MNLRNSMKLSKSTLSTPVCKWHRSRLWSYLKHNSTYDKDLDAQKSRIIDILNDRIVEQLIPEPTLKLYKEASRIAEMSKSVVRLNTSSMIGRSMRSNYISWVIKGAPKVMSCSKKDIIISSLDWFSNKDQRFRDQLTLEISLYEDLEELSENYLNGYGTYGNFLDGMVPGRLTLGKVLNNFPEEWFWELVEIMGIPESNLYEK